MAQFLMSEFLSTVTADYAYTLSVTPQTEMRTTALKAQKRIYTDNNDPLTLTGASGNRFIVELQWDKILLADAETIMELWTDTSKADGIKNSFRWYNPADTKTYVVKFDSQPTLKDFPVGTYQGIDTVKLLVMGNYVA